MKTCYIFTILLRCIGVLEVISLEDIVGDALEVNYKAFNVELTYEAAHNKCKSDGFEGLAQIKDGDQLNKTKEESAVRTDKKYWMGLKVIPPNAHSSWYWSTGIEEPMRSSMIPLVNQSYADVEHIYCFLVTNSTKLVLEIENCTVMHPYICFIHGDLPTTHIRPTAISIIYSEVTVTVTATAKIKATATANRALLTDTTMIMPSKTWSTISHVSSIPSTTPPSPGTQIQEYLKKIKKLNAVDEDSLQIAVNETSVLLTHRKREGNVLSVLQQLEELAAKYATIHLNTSGTSSSITTTKTYAENNFVMMVRKIHVGHKNDVTFPSDDKLLPFNRKEKIILSAELFATKETVIVGIIYKDIHELLSDESHALLDGKKLENATIRTRIIACTIVPRPVGVLQENVTIVFTLEKPSKAEDKPHCVFWNFHDKSRFNGSWSSRGCSLVNSTDAKVVCTCNHLTNFAVLMQIGKTKISDKHQAALEVITYIGCGLSLLGEFLTVIAYLLLMNFKQEQCQIRLNLVISIAIAQIIFLAGIDATAQQAACIFVAVSIHYFYLAGFMWMLMEGVYLYLMVVKVFNTLIKMRLVYAFSWGFPCVMVVSSLVIAHVTDGGVMSYVHNDFCWVSFSNNLVWTFAAPVLVICLVNSVILCRVVCEMTKLQASKDVSNIKQGLKACVILFPLLGMTWVFGVLSVTDAGLAFQYIFTILNSLQGFFIFVMHVLRSSDVRAAYLRKKQKWETAKNSNFPSSRSVLEASIDSSQTHAMSVMRVATESPDPLFRRHQVSPINSDIMNTRESCLTPVES